MNTAIFSSIWFTPDPEKARFVDRSFADGEPAKKFIIGMAPGGQAADIMKIIDVNGIIDVFSTRREFNRKPIVRVTDVP